jgi:caffeoyl-CoA O-methyltransferase
MIVTEAVSGYLEEIRTPPDPVLAEMEEQGRRDGVPIIEPQTGALLHVLALAAGARRILEVGTAIGVSTLYLARALSAGGRVVTFEIDAERQNSARGYLERARMLERVDLRLQDAREGLAELDAPFDLAFVDGVKAQYGQYFDGVIPLLRPGGLLIVDNALMSGTVAENRTNGHWTEEQIATAREFNRRLLSDPQLAGTLTPVGDGVLVAVRR